jgi:hypothetical protein
MSSELSDDGVISITGFGTVVTKVTANVNVYVSSMTVGVTVHVYETTAKGRKNDSVWFRPNTSATRFFELCRVAWAFMAYWPSDTLPKNATPK